MKSECVFAMSSIRARLSSLSPASVWTVLASVLFGVAWMLSPVMAQVELVPVQPWRLFAGAAFFYALNRLLRFAMQRCRQRGRGRPFRCPARRIFWITFALCVLTSLFELAVFYPAVGMTDTFYILRSHFGYISRQHPWFYVFCMKALFRVGKILFRYNYELAFVFLAVVQLFVAALVYAHCAGVLQRKGVNRLPLVLCIGCFTCVPYVVLQNITLLKDTVFALWTLEWALALYEIWESRGERLKSPWFTLRCIALVVLSLLRRNGIYVTVLILAALFLACRKVWKRVLPLAAALVFALVLNSMVQRSFNIKTYFRSAAGIPLQQVAAVVAYDGEMTPEQAELINQIVPLETIRERYNPFNSDGIKFGGAQFDTMFLNEHSREFLQVWAQMLVPNFQTYVRAYLQATYGFWSVRSGPSNNMIYTFLQVRATHQEWVEEHNIGIKTLLPPAVEAPLDEALNKVCVTWNEGQTVWCFVMVALTLWCLNGKGSWLVMMPGAGCWVTLMISTPVAFQNRYVFPLLVCIPFMAGMLTRSGWSVDSE